MLTKDNREWNNFNPLSSPVAPSQPSLGNDMFLRRDFNSQSHLKKQLQCSWDGCSYNTRFELELTNHLDDHATNAFKDWIAPAGCTWQGCKSKATFKTARSYKDHLNNIHTKPLVCDEPKCTHKRPFRNEADLSRHRSTAHLGLRPYICPYDNCPEEVHTFTRKDKWLKHIRETPHEGDKFCSYLHCQPRNRADSAGFQSREDIVRHFKRTHSTFESAEWTCALGACALYIQSERWDGSALGFHLKDCHGVSSAPFGVAYRYAKSEGNILVLRAEYVPSDCVWHDCTVCTIL